MSKLVDWVKGAVSSVFERARPIKYRSWVARLRRLVLEDAVPLFCLIRDDEPDAAADAMKQLCAMLADLEPTLNADVVEAPPAHDECVLVAQQALLELWYHLLEALEQRPLDKDKAAPVVYAVILGVVKRPEFDLVRLTAGAQGAFCCAEHDLLLAQRYRHLLCQTARYVARALCQSAPRIPSATAYRAMRRSLGEQSERKALASLLIPEFLPPPSPQQRQKQKHKRKQKHKQKQQQQQQKEDASGDEKEEEEDEDDEEECEEEGEKEEEEEEEEDELKRQQQRQQRQQQLQKQFNAFGLARTAVSPLFLAFATKFLAVAYWRLDFVRTDIVERLRAPSACLGELEELQSDAGAEPAKPSAFPMLLCWDEYHKQVQAELKEPASACRGYSDAEKAWLDHLAQYGEFFVAFVNEWLAHTHAIVGSRHVPWSRFPGYSVLAGRFVQLRRWTALPNVPTSRATFQAELALVPTECPLVVNRLIRQRFSVTPAANTAAVLETVSALDVWFGELARAQYHLGDPFDAAFFERGVGMVVRNDHHVAIAKMLQVLYKYSELFVGRARVALYGHLLLDVHFFDLFLHWDENVRTMYAQLLVFKLLRARRRDLKFGLGAAAAAREQESSSDSPRAIDLLLDAKMEAYMNIIRRCATSMKQEQPQRPQTPHTALLHPIGAAIAGAVGVPKQQFQQQQQQEEEDDADEEQEEKEKVMQDEQKSKEQHEPVTRRKPKKYIVEEATAIFAPTPVASSSDDAAPSATAQQTESRATATEGGGAPPTPVPDGEAGEVPPEKLVYVQRAYAKFEQHMYRYNEWQSRDKAPLPALISLM